MPAGQRERVGVAEPGRDPRDGAVATIAAIHNAQRRMVERRGTRRVLEVATLARNTRRLKVTNGSARVATRAIRRRMGPDKGKARLRMAGDRFEGTPSALVVAIGTL